MPTRNREAVDPDDPRLRELGMRFGLGGLMSVVARVDHFFAITIALGGEFQANIFPPVTIKPSFDLGGSMSAMLEAIPRQLNATFAGGGTMLAHVDGLVQVPLAASFNLGGAMTAELGPVELGATFAGGGTFTMTGALLQRVRASFAAGGAFETNLDWAIGLHTAFGLGGSMTTNIDLTPDYDADADTLFAAMAVQPDDARKLAISNLIVGLKAAGLWNKIVAFYILYAHDAQAARLNWKDPALYALSIIGTPVFAANDNYRGATGANGLLSGFIPSSHGGTIYQQNSASVWYYAKDFTARDDSFDIGRSGDATASAAYYVRRLADSTWRGFVNNNTAFNVTPTYPGGGGLVCASRSGSTVLELFINGTKQGSTVTAASTGRPNAAMAVCGGWSGTTMTGSQRPLQAAGFGAALNSTEQTNLKNLLETFYAS
jgi:hypothetical protein